MKLNTPQPDQSDTGLELLRNEISFWRELIGECAEDTDPDCIERMQQALALAERNLQIRTQTQTKVEQHGNNAEEVFSRIQ